MPRVRLRWIAGAAILDAMLNDTLADEPPVPPGVPRVWAIGNVGFDLKNGSHLCPESAHESKPLDWKGTDSTSRGS